MSKFVDDLRACATAGEQASEADIAVWKSLACEFLREAAATIERMRMLTGAAAVGPSFAEIRQTAKIVGQDKPQHAA